MLSTPIESLIISTGANTLTDLFIAMLVLIFLAALYLKRGNRQHTFTQYTPTLLTTVGILGTFVGIVAGLLGFDVNNIDDSISALLDGMKTAFTTSLVGMLLAVIYKVAATLGLVAPRQANAVDEDQVGAAELYQVMIEQRDGIRELRTAVGTEDGSSLVSHMAALRQAMGGDNESSVVGQVKLMRADANDLARQRQKEFEQFQAQLHEQLKAFAEMMSRSATEQVVDALRQVIVDFNDNLTEQFGENFKELNSAVIKLVDWQEQYKAQLADMIAQYTQGVVAITQTEASVAVISTESQRIPESMRELRQVLEVNQHQIDELSRHLDAFKDIRDRAVEAVPEIRGQIDATLEGVKGASELIGESLKAAGQKLEVAMVQGAQEFVDSSSRVNGALQQSSDVIAKNSEEVKEQFTDLVQELNGNFRNLVQEVATQGKDLGQQFKDAGRTMVEELNRSRDSFEAGLKSMQQKLYDSMDGMSARQSEEIQRVFSGMRKVVEEALSDTGEAVTKQVRMLDQAREREVERIAQEMGGALASISGQFTKDYKELVRAMREVTNA